MAAYANQCSKEGRAVPVCWTLAGYWGVSCFACWLWDLLGLGWVAMYILSLTQFSLSLVTLQATSSVAFSLCTRIFSLFYTAATACMVSRLLLTLYCEVMASQFYHIITFIDIMQ